MQFNSVFLRSLTALTLAFAINFSAAYAQEKSDSLCLFVSSYHPGYAWSDGVERGLLAELDGKCDVTKFYMDTKRKKTNEDKVSAGNAAYELIQNIKPDVVITADDNAAKYLIVPYLVDKDLPVVFSGINFTVEEYGFPVSNVTGIVEVAPIEPMLKEGVKAANYASGEGIKVAYLGAMTLTEIKNYNRIKEQAEKLGMTLDSILADNFEAWKAGYEVAQTYDLVVMGSNSGIANFEENAAKQWAVDKTQKLSMTNHSWMMPYTAIGFTKIPEEHGEWAAASTVAILSGVRASEIPLVTNRRWDTWINKAVLDKTDASLADSLMKNAKKYQ